MYSHVLDQWGIIYDQPIILNRRQAGAAIEGAIRQELKGLDGVAVDTHGYTDFGMTMAKFIGIDLCPRLAHLTHRKLYVPRGFEVPAIFKDITKQTVSLPPVRSNWESLVRIAASIEKASNLCRAGDLETWTPFGRTGGDQRLVIAARQYCHGVEHAPHAARRRSMKTAVSGTDLSGHSGAYRTDSS